MFCKYCGEQISYTSKWCGHCGREASPLYMYRKAVRRTEVLNSDAKSADFSGKSAESRGEGSGSAGDLKTFLENTVAVNEGNSLFNSETTKPGSPILYDEATQTDGLTFYDEATQAGGTANVRNPAASFNRSGDLVGFPGEEEVLSGNGKIESGKKKVSRKWVRIIAGIASGVLIAGLVGFGLGRIFPKASRPGTDDLVQTAEESGTTEQEVISGSEEGAAQDRTSSGDVQESTDSPVESGVAESNESGSGTGQDRDTGAGDTNGTGGGVHHDTRDIVSEAIADTEGVDPGTADNIAEKNVNGPNISGDVQVNS